MRAVGIVVLCAAASAACGGNTDRPRPDPGSVCRPLVPLGDQVDLGGGPVDCNALDGYELYLLDNWEAGAASISWYVNNDRTADSDPKPDTDPVPAEEIIGGRCVGARPSANAATVCDTSDMPPGECTRELEPESRFAFHQRTGLLTANGGQLGRGFPPICPDGAPLCHFAPGPPEVGPCSPSMGSTPATDGCTGRDFSQWEGVFVWARVGPYSADTVKVRVADKLTDDKGCVCNPYTNQNDPGDGCDKFSAFVGLDGTFRAYLVPFDRMQQGGWGMRSPGLDTSDLFSFALEYGRGSWDLWIDDIGFYRRRR
jgi:hypothetical protein